MPAPEARVSKVLFVGLDGADWESLDPLIAKGAMPNLARLVAGGASGVLEAEPPLLSPIVWTTMMTGRSPLDHRVLDFTRFDEASGARVPIGSAERRVPAVWNVASEAGKQVAVFGIWATHPAEKVNGVLLADRFLAAEGEVAGSIHPSALSERFVGEKRKAHQGVSAERFRELVPDATDEEIENAAASHEGWKDPLTGAFQLLRRTEAIRTLSGGWLGTHPWDLAIVYFDGSDTIGHLFGRYAPPKMEGVDKADHERFHAAPERYFRHLDAILGELAAIAERAGATIVLASDHGFLWGEGRPATSSSSDLTASTWHRPDGVYLIRGPGIAPTAGHSGRGTSAQIASTLLALAGVAPGSRMAPPLPGVVALPPVELADRAASAAPASGISAADAEELARLAALGYLSADQAKSSNKGKTDRPHGSRTAASLDNEALILERAGRTAEAARLYAAAVEQEPDSAAAMWNLSNFLFEQGREPERSDALMFEAIASGLPAGEPLVVERARRAARAEDPSRALRLLDREISAHPRSIAPRLVRGQLRVSSGDCRGGSADFARAVEVDPSHASAWGALGMARLCLGDADGARAALRKAVELDPGRPELRAALAKLEARSGPD